MYGTIVFEKMYQRFVLKFKFPLVLIFSINIIILSNSTICNALRYDLRLFNVLAIEYVTTLSKEKKKIVNI